MVVDSKVDTQQPYPNFPQFLWEALSDEELHLVELRQGYIDIERLVSFLENS